MLPYKDPEKARERRKQYYREHRNEILQDRRQNPKVKEQRRTYYYKNKEKEANYNRKYRVTHKEYFSRKAKEYRQRHGEEVLVRRKRHYQEHRKEILAKRRSDPKIQAYSRRYHAIHKEKENAYSRKYRREHLKESAEGSRKYRARHPEKIKAISKKYYESNTEELRQKQRDLRYSWKQSLIKHYSHGTMKCTNCGIMDPAFLTIDHIEGRKSMGHDTNISGSVLYPKIVKSGFPSGYQVLCWNCNIIKWRTQPKHYSENLSAKKARDIRSSLKVEVFSQYSKGNPRCACCGFANIDALAIDHIQGRKVVGHSKDFRSTAFYRWLKNNDYPEGYQVLCYNCNGAKRDYSICPHQNNHKSLSGSYFSSS